MTRERLSGLEKDDVLDYPETAQVKDVMDRFQVSGNPIDVARMIRASGGNLDLLAPPQPSTRAVPCQPTPAERLKAIRSWIQNCLNAIDSTRGLDPGTMNRICKTQAQGGKPRDELTEAELLRVRVWVCEQLRAANIPEVAGE